MKKIINWLFGSFFRTLGRFLVYILIGFLFSYLLRNIDFSNFNIWQILDVQAESINVRQTADGYVLINDNSNEYQTYIINPNSNATLRVKIATALSQSDIYSYMFMDLCSTRDIEAFRTSSPGQSCTNSCWSNQVYTEKTDYICTTNAQSGKIYRITTPIQKWEKDLNEEMSYVNDQLTINNKTIDIISTTIYGVYVSNDTNNGSINIDYTNIINDIGNRQITAIDASTSAINNGTEEARQNTQDIINNQNSNSQAQIDNANANTDKTIDSQKVCQYYDIDSIAIDKNRLNSNGSLESHNNFGVTDYINIQSSSIKVVNSTGSGFGAYYCYFDINKSLISCTNISNLLADSLLDIPNGASYFRSSIYKNTNKPTYEICKNGNQATNDTLNDMNNNLTNDNINEQGATDFVNGLDREYSSLTPFSDFVNLPLRWIQSLFSSQNSCEPIDLPLPYLNNKTLTLPCMTEFWQRMGALGTLIQMVWIAIVGVRIFNGLFLLTCDTLDPNPDKDMTKLRTWEL